MSSRFLLALLASLALLAAPQAARAQEAQPGDACAVANTLRMSGGPETTGKGFTMTCQGGVWVRIFESDTGGNLGVKQAAPKAPLHVGGEAIIGATTGLACDADRTGGIRWSSANSTFEMCDGSAWKLLLATGGTGTPSMPPPGTGYFVLSNGTSSGDMGGSLAAADALCLSDLQTNNWLNKSDAVSRGLLNSSHVQALFCMNGSTCSSPLANTTYTFAASGSPSTGGATFTTNGSGQGPGNTQNWSGINYFGGNHNYWTHRAVTSGSLWATTTQNPSCNGWGAGGAGNSNNTDGSRFNGASVGCSTSYKYICMVHPGNESSMPAAYFVLTNSTWNGNLGGIAGANAKCLTELTTNTNWKGYATANANGQLVASKVKAFICDGNTNDGGTNTCNDLMSNQTYSFAKVGDSNAGGASFTTNGSGKGPLDTANWSGASYFSGSYSYWTARNDDSFSNSVWGASQYYACNAFTSGSSGASGMVGVAGSTSLTRWKSATQTCNNSYNLICYVNP